MLTNHINYSLISARPGDCRRPHHEAVRSPGCGCKAAPGRRGPGPQGQGEKSEEDPGDHERADGSGQDARILRSHVGISWTSGTWIVVTQFVCSLRFTQSSRIFDCFTLHAIQKALNKLNKLTPPPRFDFRYLTTVIVFVDQDLPTLNCHTVHAKRKS